LKLKHLKTILCPIFIRNVKSAARVAWAVMNYTEHSLLVGEKGLEGLVLLDCKIA